MTLERIDDLKKHVAGEAVPPYAARAYPEAGGPIETAGPRGKALEGATLRSWLGWVGPLLTRLRRAPVAIVPEDGMIPPRSAAEYGQDKREAEGSRS